MNENKDVVELVREIQAEVEQMRLDDIANSPESAQEDFQCYCCGKVKQLAGSIIYNDKLFCNDCVLITEVCLALNQIQSPEEVVQVMENNRFEYIYNSIFGPPDPLLN